MHLSGSIRGRVAAARRLGGRIGSVVRRLARQSDPAVPSENDLLRCLGGRFGTLPEAIAALGRERGGLFCSDLPISSGDLFERLFPGRREGIVRAAEEALATCGRDPAAPRGAAIWGARELARLQHFPALGQAFRLTGDHRYYEGFRADARDWIDRRRPRLEYETRSAIERAAGAAAGVWAWSLFGAPLVADRGFASIFLRTLFAQGRGLADGEAAIGSADGCERLATRLGLLFLGILFRGAPEADVWKARAIAGLESGEGERGGAAVPRFDGAFSRFGLETEMSLTALLLAERSGFRLPTLRSRARAMADLVAHATKPDGLLPGLGDGGDARLQYLGGYGERRLDRRHLLAIAGVAFDDPTLIALAGERGDEVFWMLGAPAAGTLSRAIPAGRPAVSGWHDPSSGVAVLRHGDLYAVTHAGAVEAQAAGVTLFTLAGEPAGAPGVSPLEVSRFATRAGFDLVESERGLETAAAGPRLRRRVLLLNKRDRRFVIEDHVEGRGRDRLAWAFLLAPGCGVALDEDGSARCRAGSARFTIRLRLLRPAEAARDAAEAPSAPAGDAAALPAVAPADGSGRATTLRFSWEGTLPVTAQFAVDPIGGEA
jgi:hypothetical protein